MSSTGFVTKDWSSPWIFMGNHDDIEGQVAVKTDTGEIAKVNADDIGKGIKAIGEGIAKIGQGITNSVTIGSMPAGDTRPIYINGMANPYAYIQETSSGTTADNWVTLTPNGSTTSTRMRLDTGSVAWSDEFELRLHNHYEEVPLMQGPIRTAGVTWHIDDNVTEGDVIWAYDRSFGAHKFSKKDEEQRKKAEDKSMELLKNWLSETEYNYLMEGDLELPSQHEKDTIYIVNKDPSKRIGIKKKGEVIEKSLCIHADYAYATGDQLLANIMLLKSDEKKFLEIANVHNFYA